MHANKIYYNLVHISSLCVMYFSIINNFSQFIRNYILLAEEIFFMHFEHYIECEYHAYHFRVPVATSKPRLSSNSTASCSVVLYIPQTAIIYEVYSARRESPPRRPIESSTWRFMFQVS